MLFYHFSKIKVLKLIIKITIGVLLSSLLSAKFTRWFLLNRLEKFAEQQGLFSNMQFGFKEGVGCTEASFTILESINHMLGVAKFLGVFSTFEKLLILYGLTAYFLNCFQNLTSGDACGWP